jgi:GPH family glycoside/pentoside/hexuronide:cation symporter
VAVAENLVEAPSATDVEAAHVVADFKPPWLVKLAYSLGQSIENGYLVVSGFIFFYYTAVLGLSGSMVGMALAISMVVDSVIDPFIGSISDNVRSRFGRRLPLMVLGAPLTGLALWMLFSPPVGLSAPLLFAWLVTSKLCLRGSASLFNLPYAALTAELSNGYVERASIAAYRAVTGNLASLTITAVALSVFFAGAGGLQVQAHYPAFGAAIGLALFTAGAITCLGVWRYAAGLTQPTTAPAKVLHGLLQGVPEVFKNPSFRTLFGCSVAFWIAVAINGSFNNHAYTFVWKLRPELIQFVSYAFYGSILLGVPFTRMVLGRLEKRTQFILGLSLLIASLTVLHGLRALQLFTLTGAAVVPWLAASAAVGGLGVAMLSVTTPAMMADAADEHELLFGVRREGLYFAGLGFASKAAIGVGTMVAGVALDALHFPKTSGAHAAAAIPESTLRLLILAWGPLAAGFALIGLLAFLRYDLTRARHAEITERLKLKRAADFSAGRSS